MASAPQGKSDPMAANLGARDIVLRNSIDMWQSVFQTVLQGAPAGQVINVPIRNVGLIKRLVVEISFTLAQTAAETFTKTAFGLSNVFSNITFTDLSNQTRVNTSGWHMHMLATARRQMAFGAAFTNDSPISIGSNFAVISGPSPITTVQTCRMFYEIPLAYGDYDLRGAIYANVVNATMNLQLTVNPNIVVASTANPTQAAYISSTASLGTLANFNVNVYQNYLDQLPMSQQGPILPILDLSTAYLLNNTVATGISVGQDFAIPYANFRNFMSTFVIYDNFGSGITIPGAETNYWSIQSANYTNIIKIDPFMSSLLTRQIINDDFPAQQARTSYYFDHRRKPINTIQFGNMQLIGNFSQVQGSTSQVLVGYEALAQINMITQAGSLYNT